jgi:hypothetical protein
MRDKRIISIKNPKLQKIRNEFRESWLTIRYVRWKQNNDEMQRISTLDGKRVGLDELPPETVKRFRELQQLNAHLNDISKRSICTCYNCGHSDADMYYNKPYATWFCLDCVAAIKKGRAIMQAKKAAGTYFCDEDDEFTATF